MVRTDDNKKIRTRRTPFASLRARLIAAFSLLFAVVIIVIGAIYILGVPFTRFSGRIRQQREEAFKSLSLVADLKKERIMRWLEERRDDAHVAATNALVKSNAAQLRAAVEKSAAEMSAGINNSVFWEQMQNEEAFKNLAKYMKNIMLAYEIYNHIHIVDSETGRVIMSTEGEGLGEDVSDRDYFQGTLRLRNQYLSDVELSHPANVPVLYISHPIFSKKSEAIAVLVMEISADDIIRPMLHSGGGLGERGEALLINQDVKILTSLKHPLADGTRAEPLEYQIKAKPAVLAARGEEGIIEADDYRGEPVIAAYRYIRVSTELGWGMVVKRDRAELYAPLRRDIISTTVTALLGIAAVIGLTILTAQRLTGPIAALSRTAEKVAEGDLDARAEVTGSDEVGALAATFNSMVDSVQQRTCELSAVNK